MFATVKDVRIARMVNGSMSRWLVFFKGRFVGVGEDMDGSPSYFKALDLGQFFISEYNRGTAPEKYYN